MTATANRQARRAQAAKKPGTPGEALAGNHPVTFPDIPALYASGLQIAPIANEFILTFTRAKYGSVTIDGQKTDVVAIEPVAAITLNVITMKEALAAIQKVVNEYESEHGEIVSPFLKAKSE